MFARSIGSRAGTAARCGSIRVTMPLRAKIFKAGFADQAQVGTLPTPFETVLTKGRVMLDQIYKGERQRKK